ncbi:hypothetical protein ACOME3_006055 [Neoechinorhynchus agilis]
MSEKVQLHLERRLYHLESLQRSGLFSTEEVQRIASRTRSLEYGLAKTRREASDYLQLIKYEMSVKELCELRFKKRGSPFSKMEFVKRFSQEVINRCHSLFEAASIGRCYHDLRFRLTHVNYWQDVIKEVKIGEVLGDFYRSDFVHRAQMQLENVWMNILHVFGSKPELWLQASMCIKGSENKTKLLLRALGVHPKCSLLWRRLFTIELKKTKRNRKLIRMEMLHAVIESGCTENPELCLDFLKLNMLGILIKIESFPIKLIIAFKYHSGLVSFQNAKELACVEMDEVEKLEFLALVGHLKLSEIENWGQLDSQSPSIIVKLLSSIKSNLNGLEPDKLKN